MDNNIIDKRTPGEWVANNFMNESSIYSPSEKVGIAKMVYSNFTYPEETVQANAAFIVKACNEYEDLIHGKEYAESEGERISEVARYWQSEYDKLKEQRDSLLEALENILEQYKLVSTDYYNSNGANGEEQFIQLQNDPDTCYFKSKEAIKKCSPLT